MALLTTKNPKIEKSDKAGTAYLSCIMHLAPANTSGYQVCPHSSAGCRASCLNTAGRGKCGNVQFARIKRTKMLVEHEKTFKQQLVDEIAKFVRKCEKLGKKPAVRLNGTSDVMFERIFPHLFERFPTVQFYDYTKNIGRLFNTPKNYYLLYSRSEDTPDRIVRMVLAGGFNVAVVFDKIPRKWQGYRVVNGDNSDLRFLEPAGVVIGLSAKGRAKKDKSGFVVKT
jgi:hypothetical protein